MRKLTAIFPPAINGWRCLLHGRISTTLEPNLKVRPFDALAESIAYQQLSGRAAATIWKRALSIFPKRKFLDPKLVLETPDEKLRAAGLSRSKVAALKDLAAKTIGRHRANGPCLGQNDR